MTTTQQQQAELQRGRVGDRAHAARRDAEGDRRVRVLERPAARPGCSGASPSAARTRTRGSSSSTSPRRCAMAGVHAVLTHADVPGQKTYGLEFADQPVLAADRVRYYGEPVALVAAEEPEQARRAAAAVRVEYEVLEPVVDMERATEQQPLHPGPADDGARLPRRPAAERRPAHGHPPRRPGRRGRRHRERRLRHRHPGPGVPRARVGARRPRRRGRRRHLRRDPVAARRPRPGRAVPRPRAGAGADPPRRRRRRVRRPRGPLDADPRRHARAAHEAAGEDRLQPRGVVLRPRPPPSGADLVRAPRDARRPARQRADADPARRRRVRVELDRGHLERGLLRASARTRSRTR